MNTAVFQVPVPVPNYKVSTLYTGVFNGTWVLGYLGTWNTQCLNATRFCAGTQELVLGTQCEHSQSIPKFLANPSWSFQSSFYNNNRERAPKALTLTSYTQVTLLSNSASVLTRFIRSSSLTVLLFFWFCCCFSSCCFSTSASCEKNNSKFSNLGNLMNSCDAERLAHSFQLCH